MLLRCVSLCLISLFAAAACDLEAGPDQELVLGNGGIVLGVATPNAVSVVPGGSVVIQDADVRGRGVAVTPEMPRQLNEIVAGTGIVSNRGRVRIVQGQVSGGNVLLLAEPRIVASLDTGKVAPALVAVNGSSVDIEGGALATSSVIFGSGVAGDDAVFDTPRTVFVSDSELRIRGGTFRMGVRQDLNPPPGVVFGAFPLDAERSRVEIAGGDFGIGFVQLRGSRSRILGGQVDQLFLQPALALASSDPQTLTPGCTEVRGGWINRVTVRGDGERLILVGTFTRAPGPIPSPAFGVATVAIRGVLESGAVNDFDLEIGPGSDVSLAAPGSPGCGS